MSIILKLEDNLIINSKANNLVDGKKGKSNFSINISGVLIFLIGLSFFELAIIIALILFIFLQ